MEYIIPYSPINNKNKNIQRVIHTKKPTKIKSKVVKFEPPFHLNQFGGYRGIITFDHHYILEKVEEGTKVIQKEEYTGFYVNFWDSSWVEPAYNQVNEALKKEVLRRK